MDGGGCKHVDVGAVGDVCGVPHDGVDGRAAGLGPVGLAYSDTSVQAGGTYAYQVAAEMSGGEGTRSGVVTASAPVTSLAPQAGSGTSSVTFVTSARVAASTLFTDDPLVPGVTPLRAVHLVELRSRIDALRMRLGLPGYGWTDAVIVPGVTPTRAVHLTELQVALGAAYAAAGRSAPGYTDAGVTPGATPMRAVQQQELRSAVVALEAGLAYTGRASGGALHDLGTR